MKDYKRSTIKVQTLPQETKCQGERSADQVPENSFPMCHLRPQSWGFWFDHIMLRREQLQEVVEHFKNGIYAKKLKNELFEEESAPTEAHRKREIPIDRLEALPAVLCFPKLKHRQLCHTIWCVQIERSVLGIYSRARHTSPSQRWTGNDNYRAVSIMGRAPPGTPSPVKLCQIYSRDAFRRRTKPTYRKPY